MIVKNEAAVLERCLRSLAAHVQHWTVVDTGSADATRDLVRQQLSHLPGQLLERPWVNFGHNRSEALALSRPHCDYSLMIDADDWLELPAEFRWPELEDGCLRLRVLQDGLLSSYPHLYHSALPWHFEGALYERPFCEAPHSNRLLLGPLLHKSSGEGARAQARDWRMADARALKAELKKDPSNPRIAFHLAETLRLAGKTAEAVQAYETRAALDGWTEERYCALLQLGRLLPRNQAARIRAAWMDAFALNPERAEALVELAAFHRGREEWSLAELFSERAWPLPLPLDGLQLDPACTTWRALDERALALTALSRHTEAIAVLHMLLHEREVPSAIKPRLRADLNFNLNAQARPAFQTSPQIRG